MWEMTKETLDLYEVEMKAIAVLQAEELENVVGFLICLIHTSNFLKTHKHFH